MKATTEDEASQVLNIHYSHNSKIDLVRLAADLTPTSSKPEVKPSRKVLGRYPSVYLLKNMPSEFDLNPDLV